MVKKDKIHDEIQKMFRDLAGKSIEKNSKNTYGIMGDIHKIGTAKRKGGWYTKMGSRLNEIKIDEAVIFKGTHDNVLVRKMNEKLWAVACLGDKLKLDLDDKCFIFSITDLLNYLYKMCN